MKRNLKQKTAVMLIAAMLSGQCTPTMVTMAAPGDLAAYDNGSIVLANGTAAAPIIIDSGSAEYDGIALNAEAFAGDIKLLTGSKPDIYKVHTAGDATPEDGNGTETKTNYALASNGGVVTDAGIHEDGIKKKASVNDGNLAYNDGTSYSYWRGLNNGTAALTITLSEKRSVAEIDVIGRTEDGTVAAEDANTTSGWANRKFTVSYKDVDGTYQTIKTIDKTGEGAAQTAWDKITLESAVETDTIRIEFAADCGQVPANFDAANTKTQPSVYVTEVQVWGITEGSSGSSGTLTGLPTSADTVIVAGTYQDGLIQNLITNDKLDSEKLETIKTGYEQYNIQVVDNPFEGIGKAVVITGSDKRGTIYGLYHISQDLGGLSPWYYWGDVPAPTTGSLAFSKAALETTSQAPSVKYRGIFLNDESPSLTTWAKTKFGGLNQDFYDHVFELILRLRANYLWPAMWSNVFSEEGTEVVSGEADKLANARHADAWGVVMGTSHHEPMMRAGAEWQRIYKQYGTSNEWNYFNNGEAISKFWYDGAKRNQDFENIVTIGMRGEADSKLTNPDGTPFTLEQQIQVLQSAITDQKGSLQKLGLENSPQMICLYKEVEEAWYGDSETTGLNKWETLRDDIVMLCEDNNGNLRTLPTEEDRAYHTGGWGMYYHFDYVGTPRTYMWINTTPLAKVWANMTMAYDYGVQDAWIVNVGDLKPMELPISYFLDMAFDFDKWGTDNPNSTEDYVAQWTAQQFAGVDSSVQEGIVQLLQDYPQMSSIRRPEAILSDTFSEVNYNELQRRLAEAIDLESRAEQCLETLKGTTYEDAYYQLVYYPAAATANVNKMQLFAGLNNLYYSRGSVAANTYAALVEECIQKDKDLQNYYNYTMAGGKWSGMMLSAHVGYTTWSSSSGDYPTAKYITSPAEGAVMLVDVAGSEDCVKEGALTLPEFTSTGRECYALTISNGGNEKLGYTIEAAGDWIQIATGEGSLNVSKTLPVSVNWDKVTGDSTGTITITSASGKVVTVTVNATVIDTMGLDDKTYTASDGVIVVNASNYMSGTEAGGAEWTELEKLGKTETTMRVSPTTASFEAGAGPKLQYKVLIPEDGDYNLTVYVGPSNNVYADTQVRYAISIDDGDVQAQNTYTEKYKVGEGDEWGKSILNAGRTAVTTHYLTAGVHTVEIYGMDAGLLLEKLALSKEKLKTSHMGPSETWYAGKPVEQQSLIYYQIEESMTLPGTIYAADGTSEGGEIEKDGSALKVTGSGSYSYPVTVGADGAYIFYITGSSGEGATAILKYGEDVIEKVTLEDTKTMLSSEEEFELKKGTGTLTLEVNGDALIETIYAERLNQEPGRPVTVIASSTAEGSQAEYAYDSKKTTSWQPDSSDTKPWIGLNFDETVYTDWIRLYGSFDGVTSYEVQMSEDGTEWNTVYTGEAAPISGEKVYIQGRTACCGAQFRVVFSGEPADFAVAEMELNTFINWGMEDAETKVTVSYEGDEDHQKYYKESSLNDGDRITSPSSGAWVAANVGTTGNKSATLEFGKKRTISGVNLVALQEAVYKGAESSYWWINSGEDGANPTDTMTSANVQNSYKISYRDSAGSWVEAGTVSTSAETDKKVLTTFLFGEEVTTDAVKVEVGSYYWILMAEIEPIQTVRYTLDGVEEGYKNWALAANGGSIAVQSGEAATADDSSAIKRLNDGIRISDNGNSARWRGQHFPTTITIDLEETINLSQVNIIGQQDVDAGMGVEPTLDTDCGRYEITPVRIEYWDGSEWQAGATLTGKGRVWAQWKPDETITTNKVRFIYENATGTGSGANYVRLAELEVYGTSTEKEEDDENKLIDYALADQGGTVTATGTMDGDAANVINGEVANNNGRWRSHSANTASSLTFTLDGEKEISQIDLISQLPDSAKVDGKYPEPTRDSETTLGIKKAEIYWLASDSNWNLLAEMDEDGTKVWNRFELEEPVVTNQIRIDFPQGSGKDGYVRVIEVQIWGKEPSEEDEENGSYNLTVQNGTILSIDGKEIGESEGTVNYKDPVKVEADDPGENREFDQWKLLLSPKDFSLASASNATLEFDMPEGDVTLEAVFKDVQKATDSNAAEIDYVADPEGWAYVTQEDLDELMEDPEIVTDADREVLKDKGTVKLLLTLARKDIASGNGTAKALLKAYNDEELYQVAFLMLNTLKKEVKLASGKTQSSAILATASNAVPMVFTVPEEWLELDPDDYVIVEYTADGDGGYVVEPVGYEWLTDRQIEVETAANGSYAMIVPQFYEVTFKNYDGTVLKVDRVKAGEAAQPPEKIPEREGYVFIGWNKDYSEVTKDMTVTAKFTVITNEKKLIDRLEEILEALQDMDYDGPIETENKVMQYIREINAVDFSGYTADEEITELLMEIEAAAADLLGVSTGQVQLNGRKISNAEADGMLYGLEGGEGYLKITEVSVPSRRPAAAKELENAFALDVKLYSAKDKVVPMKGLVKFSFALPNTLKLDESLVVIRHDSRSEQGEIYYTMDEGGSAEVSGSRMTIVTDKNAIFTIANLSDGTEDPGYSNNSSGGGSSGGGGGGGGSIRPGTTTAGAGPVGSWKADEKGWWLQYPDGSYPVSKWVSLMVGGVQTWYFFDENGYMRTGWFTDTDGNTYYLDETKGSTEGMMVTGWKLIGGKWYYFHTVPDGTRGSLYRDRETPDGNRVDKDGVWIDPQRQSS